MRAPRAPRRRKTRTVRLPPPRRAARRRPAQAHDHAAARRGVCVFRVARPRVARGRAVEHRHGGFDGGAETPRPRPRRALATFISDWRQGRDDRRERFPDAFVAQPRDAPARPAPLLVEDSRQVARVGAPVPGHDRRRGEAKIAAVETESRVGLDVVRGGGAPRTPPGPPGCRPAARPARARQSRASDATRPHPGTRPARTPRAVERVRRMRREYVVRSPRRRKSRGGPIIEAISNRPDSASTRTPPRAPRARAARRRRRRVGR